MTEKRPTLNDGNIFASAKCSIKPDDVYSQVMLMTASLVDGLILTFAHLMPIVVLGLMLSWRLVELGVKPGSFVWYKPSHDVGIAYTILAVVLFFRLVPRLVSFVRAFGDLVAFCGLWGRSHSYGGRMLISGIICIGLNKFLTPFATCALSVYLSLFTSDGDPKRSLHTVIIHLVFFEFLTTLDAAVVAEYVEYRYARRCLSVDIVNLSYAVNADDFWQHSRTTEDKIREVLCRTTGSTSPTGLVSTLMSKDKGLGISHKGGNKCNLRLRIVDWDAGLSDNLL